MKGTAYTSEGSGTRDRIVASARALFLAEGLEGLSMRRIAEGAGVGTMTTYRHFENKEALLAELANEGFELFSTYFYRALEGRSAVVRIWRCGEYFLAFALEHPRYYHAMFSLDVPDARGTARMAGAQQFLVDRLRELDAPPEQIRATALSLFAHCHGMVSLHHAGRFDPALDFPSFYRRTFLHALIGLQLVPCHFAPQEVF